MLADLLGSWSARGGPLYRLLADRIAELADTGELPAGGFLPPERDLASAASVSRNTAAAAYQLLRDEGLAETRQGSGTRIRPHRTTPAAVHRANAFFAGLLAAATIEIDLTLAAPTCAPQVAEALDDPHTVLDTAARRAALDGSGYHLYGLPALRERLAEHMGTHHGVPTTAGQVLVTTGAQQATDLLLRTHVLPGQAVIVEDPTFPGLLDAVHRAGGRPIGLPVDQGLDPERLDRALATHKPALAHLVLTHHNPTGQVATDRVRRRVVDIAARHPGTVFVDDLALAELSFPEVGQDRPPCPLNALDPDRPNLVSIGSLSKTYWAGLRVGWVRAPTAIIARLAATKAAADLGAPVLPQALAAALIATRHETILRWRTEQLRRHRDALRDALRTHLPCWSFTPPPGGLSLWASLEAAEPVDAGRYAQVALRHGVAIVPGRLFSVANRHEHSVRVAFAQPTHLLDRAVWGLAAAWEDLTTGRG